jgi:hypothetical protein
MLNEDYLQKHLNLIRNYLHKWNDGKVQVWQYTVSHKTLVLRITIPSRSGNLHVICSEVSFISCATVWDNMALEVSTKKDEYQEDEYHLSDQSKKYYIVCGLIDVKENVKPLYDG